jgi:hypothetical protein
MREQMGLSSMVPRTESDITPAWLTRALATRFPGTIVSSVSIDEVTNGTSTRVRVSLDYETLPGAVTPPRSLFIKTCFYDNPVRSAMTEGRIYEHEVRFYAEVLPETSIPMPELFFAEIDPTDQQCVLILADLKACGAHWGSAASPLGVDTARVVLSHMACLHGHFFGSYALEALDWLPLPMGTSPQVMLGCARISIDLLLQGRFGPLPSGMGDAKLLEQAFVQLMKFNERLPRTFLHGDPHPGNLAFFSDNRPVFTDWQTAHKGCWAHDVSYFLVTALTARERGGHERELLREYLDQFAPEHRATPSFDRAWQVYRAQPLYGLLMWAYNPPHVQSENVVRPIVQRQLAACEELGTMQAIASLG